MTFLSDNSQRPVQFRQPDIPVAIVGMAFRFPSHAHDEGAFWNILRQGQSCITKVPPERWPADELQHPNRAEAGRSVTFAAGVLADVAGFDAAFFGISPREAAWLDPQQRLLLEMAYEAMEDAGMPPASLSGSRCGVYIGISSLDYGLYGLEDLASMSAHSMTGNTMSIAANRLSYIFNLHGPSLAIDTACSSSLVALHYACQALRTGEVPLAIAGGVNLLMHPYSFVGFSKASMLSQDGHCRPFDAAANGYVRSEGGAVLLLKPLEKALADHDLIHAVVLASGINADGGRKKGITIPSAAGQVELMGEVLARSGLSAPEIDFIEAHGTGTPVGDPVEAQAIGQIYGKGRKQPLPISSVKANLGHLEPASGMAGLVKTVLALKNRALPPAPFTYTPNPNIDFKALNLRYVDQYMPLCEHSRPLQAGVNSFGFGGVNAHILLREFCPKTQPEPETLPMPPLFLSARNDAALRQAAKNYADYLEEQPAANGYHIAWCAAFRRELMQKRLAVHAADAHDAAVHLRLFAGGEVSPHVFVEDMPAEQGGIAFVYAGNGAQWAGMGRALLKKSPRVASFMNELDAIMRPITGFSLPEALKNGMAERMDDTAVSQPLLFAVQCAITLLLRDQGITPQAVMGHSVGEICAAWASSALDIEQAARLVCARSQAQALTRGLGRMAAMGLSEQAVLSLMDALGFEGQVEVAGINSPHSVTLSGDLEQLTLLHSYAKKHNIFFRMLDLEYAFHSKKLESVHELLLKRLEGLAPHACAVPFVSTVTGGLLDGREMDSAYWWRNVRHPVRFSQGMEALVEAGCRIFVEISPHAILQRYMRGCLSDLNVKGHVLPSLQRGHDGPERVTQTALRLHLLGNGEALKIWFSQPGKRVSLPHYPWQREHFWHQRTSEGPQIMQRIHPLLGWPLKDSYGNAWESLLDPARQVWLLDHQVGGAVVFPGAGYAEIALAAARVWRNQPHPSVENLEIFAPLVFDGSRAQHMHCLINVQDGSFRILGRPRLDSGTWTLHASGKISPVTRIAPEQQLEALPAESRVMDGEELYTLTSSMGLDYGPTFRTITSLRVHKNRLEAVLHGKTNTEGHILHPALLDACFHSLVALYQKNTSDSPPVAYLPIRVGCLESFSATPIHSVRAVLRKQGPRSLNADFELLDRAGNLVASATDCRFRAMPAYLRKKEVSAWQTVPRLSPHPARIYPLVLPPLEQIASNIQQGFAPRLEERRTWFTRTLPLLEAMTLSFVLRAVRALAMANPTDWQQRLDGPYAGWLLRLLKSEGLLNEEASQWMVAESTDLPQPEELWNTLFSHAPECLFRLLAVGRVGINLKAVLAKKRDAGEVLHEVRNAPVAAALHDSDPALLGVRQAIKCVLADIIQALPKGRVVRVLELGAASGEVADYLLAALAEDQFYMLMAQDDPEVADQLRARFSECSSVNVAAFNPADWTIEPEQSLNRHFDVVILNNALHRAGDIQVALARVRGNLARGGLLLLAESYPDWSSDIVDGLAATWWKCGQNAKESLSSRLSPGAWHLALTEAGFDKCLECPEEAASDLAEGAYLLLATCEAEALPEAADQPAAQNWLLLADDASLPVAAELKARLEAKAQCVEVAPMPAANVQAHGPVAANTANHVVFMRGWADSPNAAIPSLNALLENICSLGGKEEALPHLWVFTRGGAAAAEAVALNPAQCALWGMARVGMNEYPDLPLTLLDAAPDLDAKNIAQHLEYELLFPDGQEEILLCPNGRYSLALKESRQAQNIPAHSDERYRLDFALPGRLGNLRWSLDEEHALAAEHVEAQVMATGLNFRDVMLTMGLLPDDAVEDGFAGPNLGLEFSGVITRVGEAVHNLKPGDNVVGFAPACFASHVVTPARAVAPMPEHWSHENAATVSTVFFTAWYALKHLAGLQPGERVLVHGAAGGLGLASIQVAKHLGAEIFATAGSGEKRDMLRLLGIEHVFDSRSLHFAEDVRKATHEQGVDVVLNSLAGDAMRSSLELLRPFGRFLELGKRDFVENTTLGLRPFKNNISYFAVDADQMLNGRPVLAAKLFQEVMGLFQQQVFTPLPCRVFPARHALEAFRAMQKSRHMGKIVVDYCEAPGLTPAQAKPAVFMARPDSAWLVSGGLSGFGLATARWLAAHGAKTLVLVGRRGLQSPQAEAIAEEFAALGVQVRIEACNMADQEAVQLLIDSLADMPLQGVVHAAAVFDDRVMTRLDVASLDAVLAPKLAGAWHLHQATRQLPLEYFILYSSISTALGNPGQANYVAANSGLEGLTLLRHSLGLPAHCIAWGPVGDVGYLSRNHAVKKALETRIGCETFSADQALDQLNGILHRPGTVLTVADLDWNVLRRTLPHGTALRFDLVCRGNTAQTGGFAPENMLADLAGKSHEEIHAIVRNMVTEEVAQVLALGSKRIDPASTLQALGMDSLMAVELAVGLEQRLGIRLPAMMLQDSPTIDLVTTRIVARLSDSGEGADTAETAYDELARKHGEDELAKENTPEEKGGHEHV